MNLRIEAQETEDFIPLFRQETETGDKIPGPVSYQKIYHAGGSVKAPVYFRKSLPVFSKIKGPAIIIDNDFTVVIDPGFEAETDD